jgi:hypothetical protein
MRLSSKRCLRNRNDRVKPRQKMKPIMREPNPKPERREHIRITDSHCHNRFPAPTPNACQPRRNADQKQRLNDQKQPEDKTEHRKLTINSQNSRKPVLERVNRTHHPKRIEQSTKSKNNNDRRKILAPREDPKSGPHRICSQLRRRNSTHDSNIVVWTCLHTIKTESAVNIPNFARLK